MKITFLFSCCIARLIDDMLNTRRKRRKCIFWCGVVGSVAAVFIVVAVRDILLASSIICTTDDIMNNHITALVRFSQRPEEWSHLKHAIVYQCIIQTLYLLVCTVQVYKGRVPHQKQTLIVTCTGKCVTICAESHPHQCSSVMNNVVNTADRSYQQCLQ